MVLALYTQGHNSRFLSTFNLTSLTVLIAATAFISFGQECVILTGGIDLSVGPLAGLVVVIGSFFENSGRSAVIIVAGFLVMIAAAAAVGLLNGSMVRFARFTPIVATLVTYIALQGISLVLRPFQAGYISFSILNAINRSVGPVAIAFLAAVAVAIAMEWALHRARWGRSLRAIGSDPAAAFRLGVRPGVTIIGAYVASALFACVGGVLLMAQVGVGDPTQGVNYTLASVTAVVLGGTSIFGGRGVVHRRAVRRRAGRGTAERHHLPAAVPGLAVLGPGSTGHGGGRHLHPGPGPVRRADPGPGRLRSGWSEVRVD